MIFNHPHVPLRLSTLHLSALGFDKTLILTWPFLRIVRGHSVIFTVCLFSVVMLWCLALCMSLVPLCNAPPSVALFWYSILFMSSVTLCNAPPSVALFWYSILLMGSVQRFGSVSVGSSKLQLRLWFQTIVQLRRFR